MISIPNLQIVEHTDSHLGLKIPAFAEPSVSVLVEKCLQRHGGYITARLETPKKPRTTGPRSQSAHLHGHLQSLALFTGYSMEEVKAVMKRDMPEWPVNIVKIGKVTHYDYGSEADADTVLEAKAIEWCHMRAAEINCPLVEAAE